MVYSPVVWTFCRVKILHQHSVNTVKSTEIPHHLRGCDSHKTRLKRLCRIVSVIPHNQDFRLKPVTPALVFLESYWTHACWPWSVGYILTCRTGMSGKTVPSHLLPTEIPATPYCSRWHIIPGYDYLSSANIHYCVNFVSSQTLQHLERFNVPYTGSSQMFIS